MMITKEDASSTFEFKDRYIILPENVLNIKIENIYIIKVKAKSP